MIPLNNFLLNSIKLINLISISGKSIDSPFCKVLLFNFLADKFLKIFSALNQSLKVELGTAYLLQASLLE